MNESTVIALGFFDGVHIGHGELLKMAVRRAQERGCRRLSARISSARSMACRTFLSSRSTGT